MTVRDIQKNGNSRRRFLQVNGFLGRMPGSKNWDCKKADKHKSKIVVNKTSPRKQGGEDSSVFAKVFSLLTLHYPGFLMLNLKLEKN